MLHTSFYTNMHAFARFATTMFTCLRTCTCTCCPNTYLVHVHANNLHVINMLYTKSYTNMHAFAFCYNHVHMSPHLHLHNCTCMYTHTSLSYCMLYMYTYDLHEIGMFWPRFWTRKCTSTGASTLLQLDTPMRKIRVLLQPCSHVSALVIAL